MSGNPAREVILLCLCTLISSKGGIKGKGAAANSRQQENDVSNLDGEGEGSDFSHVAGNWMIYGPVLGCIVLISLCVLYDKISNYLRNRHSTDHTLDYRVIGASCHTLDRVKVVHDPVTGLYVPIDPLDCTVLDMEVKRPDSSPSPDPSIEEVASVQFNTQSQPLNVEQEAPLLGQDKVVSAQQPLLVGGKQKINGLRQQSLIMERRTSSVKQLKSSSEPGPSRGSSPGQARKKLQNANNAEKQRAKTAEFDDAQRTGTKSARHSQRRATFDV